MLTGKILRQTFILNTIIVEKFVMKISWMVSMRHIPDYMGHGQQTLSSLQMILPFVPPSQTQKHLEKYFRHLAKL